MKTFILALATTALVAISPVAAADASAQHYRYGQQDRQQVTKTTVKQKANGRVVVREKTVTAKATPRYVQRNNQQVNQRVAYRKWAKGQRFDRRYATNYQVINNPRAYRLNNAPRGYQWVRSGNDAVLVAVASGIIGSVLFNAIAR